MPKNVLSIRNRIALVGHIRDHYTASGMSDAKFAEAASVALSFAVSQWHVSSTRAALEIPNNNRRPTTVDRELANRVDELQLQIGELRSDLRAVIASLSALRAPAPPPRLYDDSAESFSMLAPADIRARAAG